MRRSKFLGLLVLSVMTLQTSTSYYELHAQELWNSDHDPVKGITYDEAKDIGPSTYYNVKRTEYSVVKNGRFTLYNAHDKVNWLDKASYADRLRAIQALNYKREQRPPASWSKLSSVARSHRQADTDRALQNEYDRLILTRKKAIESLKKSEEGYAIARQNHAIRVSAFKAERQAKKDAKEERKMIALGLMPATSQKSLYNAVEAKANSLVSPSSSVSVSTRKNKTVTRESSISGSSSALYNEYE